MNIEVKSEQELQAFGERLGALFVGGESINLIGDVGAGKTTLTKAIGAGMGIVGDISSPSYTLSQMHESPEGLRLAHYDFYRLEEPGILAAELAENFSDKESVVVIEWAGIVTGILPADHLQIQIVPTGEKSRRLTITAGGDKSRQLLERLA